MNVRVFAFARLRELLGERHRELRLDDGARVADVWERLEREVPELASLRASTRVARNGRIVAGDETLRDGDELAFMPPSGGG